MIKLFMIGHIGNDAVLKEINGKNVISFNVAHTEKFKDHQGNQKEKTTWVRCDYWTDRTGIAPYLKKGTQVYMEGIPEVEAYQNKEGQHVAALKLKVFSVQLLGSASRDSTQSNGSTNGVAGQLTGTEVTAETTAEGGDDLPF